MGYEYEKENREAVMINSPKANRELQEVYRKAKAFDEIRNIDETFFKEHGFYTCVDEWWGLAALIISEYEEDE